MAIRPNTLIVNGTNLGTYGLDWTEREGWRGGPSEDVLTIPRPGGFGEFFQEQALTRPRMLTVRGTIIADTIANLNSRIDTIKALLLGQLQVKFSDDTRYLEGYVQDFDIGGFGNQAVVPGAPYTLVIKCPDPRRWDASTTTKGEDQECPLGTAKVGAKVTITGAASSPTIAIRDKDSTIVSSFTMTGSLGAGAHWVIDGEAKTVELDGSSAIDAFSGSFPILDPEDGDALADDWPTFDRTAGTAAGLSVEYRKAWK